MSALARQYEAEWIRQLKSRGVEVNGATPEERRQQLALAQAVAHTYRRRSPAQALRESATAFAKARRAGRVKYVGD